MTEASLPTEASIVVSTARRWYGYPRLGTFVVYLDGARVGTVPPEGSLCVPCSSGRYQVRTRQWWYRSPPFEVVSEPGRTLHLMVDIVRSSLIRRMLTLMFAPWRGVTIWAASADDA